MKELGVTDKKYGIETTFEDIFNLTLHCKFTDCTHTREAGCAILEALEKGEIDKATLENYRKIQRDQQRFQTTVAEKHKMDIKFGRFAKSVMKEKKKNKY